MDSSAGPAACACRMSWVISKRRWSTRLSCVSSRTVAMLWESLAPVEYASPMADLLVNADCVKGALRHLPDASVDLIITDPPYGIEGDRLHRNWSSHRTIGL